MSGGFIQVHAISEDRIPDGTPYKWSRCGSFGDPNPSSGRMYLPIDDIDSVWTYDCPATCPFRTEESRNPRCRGEHHVLGFKGQEDKFLVVTKEFEPTLWSKIKKHNRRSCTDEIVESVGALATVLERAADQIYEIGPEKFGIPACFNVMEDHLGEIRECARKMQETLSVMDNRLMILELKKDKQEAASQRFPVTRTGKIADKHSLRKKQRKNEDDDE